MLACHVLDRGEAPFDGVLALLVNFECVQILCERLRGVLDAQCRFIEQRRERLEPRIEPAGYAQRADGACNQAVRAGALVLVSEASACPAASTRRP